MLWKIIFLLSCFNVLVNATGGWFSKWFSTPPSQSNLLNVTEEPNLFQRIEQWIESLEVKVVKFWGPLARKPNQDQKRKAKAALEDSKCPTGAVDTILLNSHIRNWPEQILNTRSRVVYVAHSDNDFVSQAGILFIFESLVFEEPVQQNLISPLIKL
ncbi:E3 ubiquitin-protein ligase NRDP1-like [Adelges cooleyi]|uniref:E3 ubiquitin-protein ligase NRDP1-like n=1 Tax=Adelges cooleyi TaxID=133065 RepID=UPI002180177E|nr:E3 ubiquitin-protein ligase NRDP1-like isoform X2 [Adelges cooleyi]XP_050434231.1 E3 ubiquitin-protein ligase NRDP1-like [Adelges cooleyi]